MPRVQDLYEACKGAFVHGQTPSLEALQRVKDILDTLTPADVGLEEAAREQEQEAQAIQRRRQALLSGGRGSGSEHNAGTGEAAGVGRPGSGAGGGVEGLGSGGLHGVSKQSNVITYLHLFESKCFSIGIFCLPRGACIPLHNHPGMIVLSKLLYGSMHIKSLDWVVTPPPPPPPPQPPPTPVRSAQANGAAPEIESEESGGPSRKVEECVDWRGEEGGAKLRHHSPVFQGAEAREGVCVGRDSCEGDTTRAPGMSAEEREAVQLSAAMAMATSAQQQLQQTMGLTSSRLAVLVEDGMVSSPCAADVLFPTCGGNIHSFTAITPCAVLDVLAPPYDAESGRHCTYFREVPWLSMLSHSPARGPSPSNCRLTNDSILNSSQPGSAGAHCPGGSSGVAGAAAVRSSLSHNSDSSSNSSSNSHSKVNSRSSSAENGDHLAAVSLAARRYRILEEYQPPDDFVVRRGIYVGPKMIERRRRRPGLVGPQGLGVTPVDPFAKAQLMSGSPRNAALSAFNPQAPAGDRFRVTAAEQLHDASTWANSNSDQLPMLGSFRVFTFADKSTAAAAAAASMLPGIDTRHSLPLLRGLDGSLNASTVPQDVSEPAVRFSGSRPGNRHIHAGASGLRNQPALADTALQEQQKVRRVVQQDVDF